MTPSTHPTREQLQSWLSDQLDVADAAWIEQHLEECEECASLLDELEIDTDSLVLRLQTPTGAITPIESEPHAGSTIDESGEFAESDTVTHLLNFRERWQPQKLLARGGIGEIWIGRDVLLGRQVAIKRLREETRNHPRIVSRFLREARITARVNHPGTVYMLDLVSAGPKSYYVMSLVEGESLSRHIARMHAGLEEQGEIDIGDLFPLLQAWVSVAKTISFAHLKRILHRDLKSDNVVIGDHGQVTVIDWGLAKMLDDGESDDAADADSEYLKSLEKTFGLVTQTSPGTRLGTPAFMAPEQARGDVDAIDERTDVYGLAAMLYEILTGQPPFGDKGVGPVLDAVIQIPPKPPSRMNPAVPEELDAICLAGLAKDPLDRPQTAKVFADEVEDWMGEESERNQSREARHQLFELSGDLMATLNHGMEIVWVNSAWERELGWDLNDLLGKTATDLIHPDDIDHSQRLIERAQNRETVEGVDRRILTGSGDYRWFSFASCPVPGENLVCLIGRDIEARMRREVEFAKLLDAAPDAMVVIARNQTIRYVNQQVVTLFGYEQEELLYQPLELLVPERLRATHTRHVADYILKPSFRPLILDRPLLARHKSGDEFPVAISLSFVKIEQQMLYASSIRRLDPEDE